MSQAQIQTFASCTQATFPAVLQRFQHALRLLGSNDQQVLSWITDITWPRNDNDAFGDIYAAPLRLAPPAAPTIECAGIEVSLYTQPAIPSLEELPSWIGFNLLIESEQLQEDIPAPYTREAGESIWSILQILARDFTEVGAYFTNEWQENQVWRAIVETAGDPWVFDLGIFPRKLATHFEMVPAGFKGTLTDAGFGFAQLNRWQQLPWEQTANS
ncbi:hypothetical protein [Dictyobacter formicarum]|uniref:Uncharacterized protein n=1 Tax=Dictyobacter formicarum TaxID=2778368 RepID=A0ABQ3VK22_9CHLR|nr:hypothetical protein [Dictyobacter formicarum]GHO86564.1 hypothetical protein KSZ_45700 [Dictyobacter formicarum]